MALSDSGVGGKQADKVLGRRHTRPDVIQRRLLIRLWFSKKMAGQ